MARSQAGRPSVAAVVAGGFAVALGLSACGVDEPAVEVEGQTAVSGEFANLEPGDEAEPDELLKRLSSPGAETLSSFDFAILAPADGEDLGVSGAVDLTADSPALDVSLDLPPMGVVDLLLVSGSAYVTIPGLTPEGKYFEVPAEDIESMGAQDLKNTLDLDSLMQTWDSSAQEVTFVGTEEINGEETDHYELQLDPQKVLDELGETAGPEVGSEFGLDLDLASAGTYGIWVGDDDLIAKMVIASEDSQITITLDDWGQELQLQAPVASDVITFPGF